MYTPDENKFLTLRSQFHTELETIERHIGELEIRRAHLIALLDGSIELSPEEVQDPDSLDIDNALYNFLRDNPHSKRKQIDDGLTAAGFTRYAIDKALKRSKTRGLIANDGNTRQASWYARDLG